MLGLVPRVKIQGHDSLTNKNIFHPFVDAQKQKQTLLGTHDVNVKFFQFFISFFVEYWFQKIWSDGDKNLDSSLGMSEARKSKNFVTLILKSFKKWRLHDMHSVWTDGGIKSCPNFHKKLHCFWMKTLLSKISKIVDKFLGYFCWKICCKELSKFLQSGPTACIT